MDERMPGSPEAAVVARLVVRLGQRTFAHLNAVAQAIGLPPPVAMALHLIEPSRPGPMNELAGALGCDPSFVTWIADQLESRGLARRQSAPHDRRVKVLSLTEAGVAKRVELVALLGRLPVALDRLSVAEATTLVALLNRILDDEDQRSVHVCTEVEPEQLNDCLGQATAQDRGVVEAGA